MLSYIARRFGFMLIFLFVISIIAFIIIQLPPGDYLTSYIMRLEQSGEKVDAAMAAQLRRQYGLDLPMHRQYLKWIGRMFQGDLGVSFEWQRPVTELLAERLPMTVVISFFSLLVVYLIAVPIGIYSATHQYSVGDHVFTFFGFIGLAIPNFLLGLVLLLVFNKFFGVSIGGLFSREYLDAAWSWGKFVDMLKHLPAPLIVIGTAGAASIIRVMRGSLLDELQKQYVVTARAKGVGERRLVFRYPVRVAMNPVVSTIGWVLPTLVSGETITAVVLSLPTVGPLLLEALLQQDMFIAGSIVMIQSFMVVLGTFLSDMLLVTVDPRIRFERAAG
jgi:peptide/nickel transport system permease protein